VKSVYLESGAQDPSALALFDGIATVTIGRIGDDHEARAIETGANALIVGGWWKITGPVLDRMPAVEVVARPGIGYDSIDLAAATARGVAIVNTPDGPTESTAEHTVMLLLAVANQLRLADQAARDVRFKWADKVQGVEVAGKTVGLVGIGRIGGRVAEICSRGLHMRIIAYDPYATPARAADVGATLVENLDEMLSQVDFLSLHAPPTPETRKMIDARALSLMKPTAYLINCARGALVDEAALIEALETGRLAGAGLDVYDPEPPAPDNRLLQLDNVILTPHIGAFTEDGIRAMTRGVVEQIVDVFQDRRPPHLLNPDVWDSPNRRSRQNG